MIAQFIESVVVEKEWGYHVHVDDICKDGRRYKKYWVAMALSLAYEVNRMLVDQGIINLTGIVSIELYANERAKMGFPFQQLHDIQVDVCSQHTPPDAHIFKEEVVSNFYQNSEHLGTILIGEQPFDVLACERFEIQDGVEHGRWLHLCPHAASYSAKPLK